MHDAVNSLTGYAGVLDNYDDSESDLNAHSNASQNSRSMLINVPTLGDDLIAEH